jgi:3-deoxy-D-manno-octulosonic-acid transferase
MSRVANQLTQVLDKTARLVELCAALQEENDNLKLDNQSLQVAVETSKKLSSELEERVRALKLARSLEGDSEKSLDIKQKISEFVREIDKCIVLLKK